MSVLHRAKFLAMNLANAGSSWRQNEQYVAGGANNQSLADLFAGEWASALPMDGVRSGTANLFADERLAWALAKIGPLDGKSALDLGPLEGGHSFMMEKAGAARVTAIEAHKQAFLKCLVVKEALALRTKFVLADFDTVLRETSERYDLVVTSGVLYHLADPLQTLLNIMRTTDTIYIWSHFFDDRAMPQGDKRRMFFTGTNRRQVIGDDALTYHERAYGRGRMLAKFCGGMHANSVWLDRGEVLALLERRGFKTEVAFDQPDHVNGPACSILARRA